MWFWIIFSMITPAVLFIIGEILFLQLDEDWPGIVCWILALAALGIGLYFCVVTAEPSKEDIEDPAPIVEVETDYNYCPYCGAKIEEGK